MCDIQPMDSTAIGKMSRDELIAEVLSLQTRNSTLESEKTSAESRRAELEFQLEQIKRMIFGARSERVAAPANPNQLELDLGLAVEAAREEARKEPRPKR